MGLTSSVIGLTNTAAFLQDGIRFPHKELEVVMLDAFLVPVEQKAIQDDEALGQPEGLQPISPRLEVLCIQIDRVQRGVQVVVRRRQGLCRVALQLRYRAPQPIPIDSKYQNGQCTPPS
jgi:hypothetical protein